MAYLSALCFFSKALILTAVFLSLPLIFSGLQLGATQCGSLFGAGKSLAAGMVKAGLSFCLVLRRVNACSLADRDLLI